MLMLTRYFRHLMLPLEAAATAAACYAYGAAMPCHAGCLRRRLRFSALYAPAFAALSPCQLRYGRHDIHYATPQYDAPAVADMLPAAAATFCCRRRADIYRRAPQLTDFTCQHTGITCCFDTRIRHTAA